MKKIYIIAAGILVAASNMYAQNGNISNGGFEDWTDATLYNAPDVWLTSNNQFFEGVSNALQSSDAIDGTYSMELQVVEVNGDTITGYALHGTIGGASEKGIPYTDVFDEVRIQYKSDFAAGDSLYMYFIRFLAGAAVETQIVPIASGTISTWTLATANVGATIQDSLFIGFIAGSLGASDPTPGSWARIDDVSLFNSGVETTTLPNHSFEDWTPVTAEDADNWTSFNSLLASSGLENVTKSTNANSGMYAARLEVGLDAEGDTMSAFITNGEFDFNAFNPFVPIPYNASPTTFSGAYNYTPENAEQGSINLEFFEAGISIGIHLEILTATSGYSIFNVPLTLTGTPDSMSLIIYAGDELGTILLIDDLVLSGGDVSLNEFSSMNVSMYPNPASSTVMIKAEGTYDFTIVDLAGNVVLSNTSNNGAIKLNINNLSSGAYLVQINNAFKSETHKLIVE